MNLNKVAQAKHIGDKTDKKEGNDSNNKSNESVNKTGGSGSNFLGVARTEHVVPASHNEHS